MSSFLLHTTPSTRKLKSNDGDGQSIQKVVVSGKSKTNLPSINSLLSYIYNCDFVNGPAKFDICNAFIWMYGHFC